ncbi:MAG TPA: DUF1476 domain-containing protein [Stellaceae bacterium]
MSSFDEREKGFERKYQQDQEFAFKVKSRRNRIAGHWAAGILGKNGADADAYAAEIVAAEFQKHGEESVIAKLTADLAAKGLDRDRVLQELEKAMAQARVELGG